VILRSITRHVRDQNWFAVGLDFFIVVVGVFIGIQVANWNEERADARLESEILQNIAADLRSDEAELSSGIRMAQINVEAGNYALVAAGLKPLEAISLPSQNSNIPSVLSTTDFEAPDLTMEPNWLWRNIVVRYHPGQSSAAFDTLVATGRLGLISEQSLVRQIQLYRRRFVDIEISQNQTFRPFRDRAIFVGQKSGLSPFSDLPEQEFVSILRQDRELQGAVRTMVEYAFLHYAQLIGARDANHELLESLERELAP